MQQTHTKARPAKGKADQPRNSAAQLFSDIANRTSQAAGRALTFMIAAGIILVWLVTGPIYHYSDTWQLVINTATTIVTFLMVFLIQNTQNRDSEAVQVKLEELEEHELDSIRDEYVELAKQARSELKKRGQDPGAVEA